MTPVERHIGGAVHVVRHTRATFAYGGARGDCCAEWDGCGEGDHLVVVWDGRRRGNEKGMRMGGVGGICVWNVGRWLRIWAWKLFVCEREKYV